MRIEELNAETVQQYRHEIAQFYYENMQTCSCFEHFTFDRAYKKIGGLINHLSTNTCIAYGAFEDNEIIGYIWAYPHRFREDNRMYVNEIHVRKDCCSMGYGRELLSQVEKRAREMGFPAIYLHAEANNVNTRRFYENAGYIEERVQFRKELYLCESVQAPSNEEPLEKKTITGVSNN